MNAESRQGEVACEACGGARQIDLNANWHGPPGVERHHWHPCPECAHLPTCGAVHEKARAVCTLALGHGGDHANSQGYWLDRIGGPGSPHGKVFTGEGPEEDPGET